MQPAGDRQVEGLVEEDLSRGGRQEVGSSEHVGDAHRSIVDGDRELIGGDPVLAAHDEVTGFAVRLEGTGPLKDVDEPHHAFRHAEAEGAPGRGVRHRASAAGARVSRPFLVVGVRSAGGGHDLASGAVTAVEMTVAGKSIQRPGVEILAFGLSVGGCGAVDVRPLVPVEAEPSEVVELGPAEVVAHASNVEIFDPQNETPAGGAHLKPGEQRSAGVADVQVSGGARSEATAQSGSN